MPSKQLHNKVLAGGCETAKHHGPEGRNDLQKHAVPGLDVPFSILVKTKRVQLLGLLLLLLLELVPNVAFWTNKKPAPKCSSHTLKATPQQSPSGRLRNSKTPWPWRAERPPKTCCPGAWRPFWILVKTKQIQLLGLLLLLLLEMVPNVAFWTNKKPAPKCSSHALKAAPQQSPSGRLRNSKTPWPWRTERSPKTCCPGAWRAFWILVKNKASSAAGPAAAAGDGA